MQTLFNTIKNSPAARPLRQVAPWAILGMSVPALLLFNGLFIGATPDPSADAMKATEKSGVHNLQNVLAQALNPDNYLVRTAYVYNTRNPNELFGNFYYTLGTQLAARGQLIPAEATLAKAVHLLPNDPFGHMNYGIVLEALEKYPDAAAQYQEATRLDSNLVQAFYSLGLLQDKMGKTDVAIQTLQHAVSLAPNNGFINYDLGVLYAKKTDYKNSAVYSKKAVENGGDFAEAYNNYGYALAQLGQYEEALKMVDKSLALKPDSAAALDSKGYALFGMGKYKEALTAYQDALKQDPTIGEIYLHIGDTYEKLQEREKAMKSYQTYLQMTPDAPDKALIEAKIKQLGSGSPSNDKK